MYRAQHNLKQIGQIIVNMLPKGIISLKLLNKISQKLRILVPILLFDSNNWNEVR
jgi:hypothetical protein